MTIEIRKLIKEHEIAVRRGAPGARELSVRLSAIIVAAGLGDISFDKLEDVTIADGDVTVTSSYAARGSENLVTHEFPESILDADDPVQAARSWAKQRLVAEALEELGIARQNVVRCQRVYDEAVKAAAEV